MSVPTILALAGTALMTLAIFVPRAAASRPAEPRNAGGPDAPDWPRLVGPGAAACDPAARIDLIEALATLGSPWAARILERAGDEEREPAVRAAIAQARAALADAAMR